MASPHWSVDRLREEIELLGTRGLPRDEYFAQLAPRLRRVIDNDASCWHTLDPQTRLMTSDAPAELVDAGSSRPRQPPLRGELLVRSEYLVPDSNTFAELAARRIPVGILHQATRGNPERSARYRDLLEPSGIPHRASCGVRHPRAGVGCGPHRAARAERRLHAAGRRCPRARRRRDRRRHSGIAPLRRRAARLRAPRLRGSSCSTRTNDVELITPPARELLAALGATPQAYADEAPPATVLALARMSAAVSTAQDPRATSSPSRARPAGSRCTPRSQAPATVASRS